MKKYKNKKLGFTFYIDKWNEHTDDKLRIYDSNKDYCDYIEEDSVWNCCERDNSTPQKYIKSLAKQLQNAEDMYEFMSLFSYDFMIEKNFGQEKDDLTNVFGEWLVYLV